MKTVLNILVLFLLTAGACTPAFAAHGDPKAAKATKGTKQQHSLASEVREHIGTPPASLRINLDGEAEVFFTVSDKGTIELKGVFSTSDALTTYVEDRLEGARVTTTDDISQTYRVKFKMIDLR